MAAATLSLPCDSSSTTNFRIWGLAISNTLSTFGLSKTTDTGQINWATVSGTSSNDTAQGYEIRTFTDSLTSTINFFFKFEYGCGANSAASMWITVGTGSNGAGTLTGQVGTRSQFGNDQDFTSQNCYLAGSNNYLTMALFDGPNTTENCVMSIERTKDNNGNDTTAGCIMWVCANRNGIFNNQVIPATGVVNTVNLWWSAALSYNSLTSPTMSQGTNIGVAIPQPFNFFPYNPGYGVLLYQSTDIGAYSQVSLPMYSGSHNYLAIGQFTNPTIFTTDNSGSNRTRNSSHILIRFE